MNALNNSGEAWAVNTVQLNYSPGLDSYQINVTDFGKPILVVRETTNPYVPFLPVPFDTITDLQYGTIWNQFWNSWGAPLALRETIEHIAFYRSSANNQQTLCKIQPQPIESATYIISYIPSSIGYDDPLETQPAMAEYQELLRLRTSLALLPYVQWSEDRAKDAPRKAELRDGFLVQLNGLDGKSGWEFSFKEYISSLTVNREVSIADWNEAPGW